MNKLLPTSVLYRSTQKIIFLNLKNVFLNASKFVYANDIKHCETLDALSHEPLNDIHSIIANFDLLVNNDFEWLKNLRKKHQNIPIIAIKSPNTIHNYPPSVLLQNGIDDCYDINEINFRDLVNRIGFMKKNKYQINESQQINNEKLEIKMPLTKRIFDIVVSSIAIILLSPVFLLTAILVRLESKGSIIYRSRRIGCGYQEFDFFKFRSMYADADKRLKEMENLNQYKGDTIFIKIKNDPRITKVGRIIRKYSIDELPQLFNVLFGHMSIIGNRPLPLYEAELLTKENAAYRFLAPAGITGLWQVTKRGGNDMLAEERINLDITYAENMSLWFDLKILFKTPFSLVQKENV